MSDEKCPQCGKSENVINTSDLPIRSKETGRIVGRSLGYACKSCDVGWRTTK